MRRYRFDRGQVWLFGTGLIGGSIADALGTVGDHRSYDWTDAAQRAETRAALTSDLQEKARLDIIWSAGRSGFSSTAVEMENEAGLLAEIADEAAKLAVIGRTVTVHMISSAGGLYEGQTNVTSTTPPTPRRPYGHGKLAQETALTEAAEAAGFDVTIYRPSSIYGYRSGARLGLVATLITRALSGEVTHITGERDTLRDYVLADDIGRFVANCVTNDMRSGSPHLLCSGQSATILQVIDQVSEVLKVPVKLEYGEAPPNAAHMTFRAEALPDGWQSTDIADGIARTADAIRKTMEH